MEKRTWPALKSCKHQPYQGKGSDNDRLSQLPHDILMSIMSLLTIKEAAQTSVLSHGLNYIWRCFPILIFKDDHPIVHWVARNHLLLPQERSNFVTMVKSVLESHLGVAIDELSVVFDLDVSYESDIDRWLAFAIEKHVKRLELDFTPQIGRAFSLINCYTWPLECRLLSLGLHCNLVSLTSLCLKYVNVTDKDIECVLLSCHALENLCIVDGSSGLKCINMPQTSLQLKHLELSCCYYLSCIDIMAPKLVSFTLHGHPIALNIRASSLSKVSIGSGNYRGEVVAYAYRSLSQYLSNLEYLSWHLFLKTAYPIQWNTGISKPPIMSNLKHLELHVQAKGDESLLGWAYLIGESPVLEKLTLKFSRHPWVYKANVPQRNIVKHKGRPLKNLKTLEHCGFLGLPIDIEFATYVVENSIKLKDVIFTHPQIIIYRDPTNNYAKGRVLEFIKTLPQEVAFKFGKPANHCCPISTYPYF
ncbi:FBD-associated F-box protein At3g49020-like [Chenopodium quinoa]|uniref:F-box domain-containing protein n=1 Tax=Chenopodium quinoa TaxID=63459 RepID=A0A803LHR8_CHEQI|nr:FBD-associated F-box protein At3g49020-like [Chenopodium quinoa]XP_021760976.1 FBD-associated F-box protein At3g49020-like [Chenopodium quinoa]